MAIALAALEILLEEAPQRGWASPLALSLAAMCAIWRRVSPSHAARRAAGGGSAHPPGPRLCARLLAELSAGMRALWLGLFDAGVPGAGAAAQRVRDRAGHAGDRRRPAADRADCGAGRAALRSQVAVGLRLRAVRRRAGDELFPDLGDRLRPDAAAEVVRGIAIMFCLLPPTRLALGHLAPEEFPMPAACSI